MDYTIETEMPGRIRVKLAGPVPQEDLGALEAALDTCPDIQTARVYPRIGSIAVTFAEGSNSCTTSIEQPLRTPAKDTPSRRPRRRMACSSILLG